MRDLDELQGVTDPAQRVREATRLIDDFSAAEAEASRIRLAALAELQENGLTQTAIADATGMSRARISQLIKKGPPSWRALLAPGRDEPLTVAMVRKKASDSGGGALAIQTQGALQALLETAARLQVPAEQETIPPPGEINLNRSNLAVLIGPRISALIVQALSADPVIKWRRDRLGNWFITDTQTGEEYHSDFDEGHEPSLTGGMVCVAHIGRIRRPDGNGGFLYLGGAHAPGTAGAVKYLLADIETIYDEVHRGTWSAVVRTVTDDDDMPQSWERVTPIYTHGKR